MSKQTQKQKQKQHKEHGELDEIETPPPADQSETDELLDEIDDLLEEIGVETAKNYVQKGGE